MRIRVTPTEGSDADYLVLGVTESLLRAGIASRHSPTVLRQRIEK